jgi:hypothetical protein
MQRLLILVACAALLPCLTSGQLIGVATDAHGGSVLSQLSLNNDGSPLGDWKPLLAIPDPAVAKLAKISAASFGRSYWFPFVYLSDILQPVYGL